MAALEKDCLDAETLRIKGLKDEVMAKIGSGLPYMEATQDKIWDLIDGNGKGFCQGTLAYHIIIGSSHEVAVIERVDFPEEKHSVEIFFNSLLKSRKNKKEKKDHQSIDLMALFLLRLEIKIIKAIIMATKKI